MPTCRDDLDCLQQIEDNVYLVNERFRDVVSFLTARSDTTTYLLIPIVIFLILLVCIITLFACRFYNVIVRVHDRRVELVSPDQSPLIDS